MTARDFASELKKIPFQPFRIVMTDGRKYDITERDVPMVWIGNSIVLIGFRVAEDHPFFDRYEAASLDHIVRLEPIPLTQQKASA